jgi:hypothetical protein
MLLNKLDCLIKVSRQIIFFMILARNILIVGHIVTIVIEGSSISCCQYCLDRVTIESTGVLSGLEVTNVDAADIILVGVFDTLNILRVYGLCL